MRQHRWLTAALAFALLLPVAAQAGSGPLIVDGEGIGGSHLQYGGNVPPASQATTPPAGSGGAQNNTGGASAGEAAGEAEPDWVPPHATPDPNLPPKWAYDGQVLYAGYQGSQAEVLSLGTVASVLKTADGKVEVYTRDLSFAPKTEGAATGIAMIVTGKSGRISMFKRASKRSPIIMKCYTGHIVPVLGAQKGFVLIQYQDAVGYVQKSRLKMLSPSEGKGEFAYVAVKNNPRSKDQVKVRQSASGASRILGEFPCGQRVAVISRGSQWTEIEAQGIRCFILNHFLTTVPESEAVNLPVRGIGSRVHCNADEPEPSPAPTPASTAPASKPKLPLEVKVPGANIQILHP